MWPLIEALLAAIGAGTIAFVVGFFALSRFGQAEIRRGDGGNVDWPLAYERLWDRYLAQDAEIRRLKGADGAGGDTPARGE